ncbi:MAG TPA: hypothetical protein VEK11_20535 [Thermoanaerobaculia bacterium]|jgi:uncharacterized cupredoxin-like copper-binding protein|nr:hypothetical protein [Thermoanaerobaculia bacterium]
MKQRVLAALLLTSLAAFGCREEGAATDTAATGDTTTDTAAAIMTDTATHPGSPGGTALVPEVAAGTTVLVVLEDNSIGVREQAIPPGPAVLTIENRGSELHNLFVEGEGISRAADNPVPENGSSTLDVTFRPGTYTLYCPVGQHRTRGEQVQITIAAAGGEAPATATSGTTTTSATTTTQ